MKKGVALRDDIDGLRGVAVLAVIAFHAFPGAAPGGFTGVDVFFVISGFLITTLVLHSVADQSFSYRDFYARRLRRLLPALLLVLATALVFGWFELLAGEYLHLGRHVAAGTGFVSNLLLWNESGYFDTDAAAKPLLHLWSLGVEGQFYLVWPFLLVAAARAGIGLRWLVGAVGVASFAFSLYLIQVDPVAAFYSPLPRAWEFMAGSWLALARLDPSPAPTVQRQLVAPAGLALLVLGFAAIDRASAFPGTWALLPVMGTCLLIAAGPQAWFNRQVLAHRVVVGIGLISYPLYLWHWVALHANAAVFDYPPSRWSRAMAIAISLLLAVLTYRYVERPIRARQWGSTGTLLAGAALVLACGLAVVGLHGAPERVPAPVAQLLEHTGGPDPSDRRCTSADGATLEGACQRRPGKRLVVLWGDSHAARLGVGLWHFAQSADADFIQYAALACPPLRGFQTNGNRDCEAINERVIAAILAARPALVVVHARWQGGNLDPARLGATAQALQALRARMVVVGPVPQWQGSLPRAMFRCGRADPSRTPARWSRCGLDEAVAGNDAQMAAASRVTGLPYISAYDVFCQAEGCMRYTTGTAPALTSEDYGHLSPSASRYLVGQFDQRLTALSAGR